MTAQRTKHLNYFFSSFRFLKSGSWIPSDYRSTKYVIFASGLHLMKMQERSQKTKIQALTGFELVRLPPELRSHLVGSEANFGGFFVPVVERILVILNRGEVEKLRIFTEPRNETLVWCKVTQDSSQ